MNRQEIQAEIARERAADWEEEQARWLQAAELAAEQDDLRRREVAALEALARATEGNAKIADLTRQVEALEALVQTAERIAEQLDGVQLRLADAVDALRNPPAPPTLWRDR